MITLLFETDYVKRNDYHTDDDYHFHYSTGLNVEATANHSGIYSCSACRAYASERPDAVLSCSRSDFKAISKNVADSHFPDHQSTFL